MRHTWLQRSSAGVFAIALLVAACGSDDADLGAGHNEPTPTVPIAWIDSASPVATEDYCGYQGSVVDPALMGTPEIHPSLTPEPGKPAFTEEDVRAWVAAMESDENPVVKRVEFMSACEVATKVNHPVYRPDDTLLALVTLTGDWQIHLPPEVTPVGPPDPDTVAYWIFDAVTGHLIGSTSGVESP